MGSSTAVEHPVFSGLEMPALPPGSAGGGTSPHSTAPQKQDGEGGDSRGQGGQEQGSLYPARPRLMSPAGAANGKDKLAPALLVLGRAGDVPRDIPRSCRAQGWRRWGREHPYLSRLQGFLWDLLSNTELLCCSPFPASSRCPRSLLDAHTAQSCPLSSLRGPHGAGHPEPQPLSPLANPWHGRTPGGPGRQGWLPGLRICPARTVALSRAMSPCRALQGAGRSRYIPLQGCTTGRAGQHRNSPNQCFPKKISAGSGSLNTSEGSPGEAGLGWDTWHSQQNPSSGKGNSRADPALPARRREVLT